MTSEEILASITRHYLATNVLTAEQLREHKQRGACPGCEDELEAYVAEAMADAEFAEAYRTASLR